MKRLIFLFIFVMLLSASKSVLSAQSETATQDSSASEEQTQDLLPAPDSSESEPEPATSEQNQLESKYASAVGNTSAEEAQNFDAPPSESDSESDTAYAATDETESAAPDQPQKPLFIIDVEVRGNRIVSTSTILSKIKSQKGAALAQETINQDLKRLYATGFFQDIQIDVEQQDQGFKLIVVVDEKPIVRQIQIEGFTAIKEDKLRKEFKLIEGQILDEKAVKEGVEAIRKLYADKGYRFVDVQTEINVNPQNKEATVVVRIAEGEKYKITDIRFEGVQAFKTRQIKRLMKTRKKQWYTLSSGVFKESVFQKDLENIQLFYQQEGYLDIKVDARFDYDKDKKQILITLVMEEGQHYVTGDVKISGNQLFPESEIWGVLDMLPGQTYSQFYLYKDIEAIKKFYADEGYIEARIIPDIKLNRDTGKVDVSYEIQEGDLFFVQMVMVRGNTKTKDIVIRRELRIRPGERFDGEKIEKSKQRLENLGYFEEITYDTEPVQGEPNRKNIIFRVKEKRTGELSFGGGVSSVDQFLGFAEVSQRNFDLWNFPRFTGGGQSLSIRARVGTISQDYSVSFVEPYLFNKPISMGIDVYNTRLADRNVDFATNRLGAGVTFSRLFRDVFRLGTGYTLERVKLHDIAQDAPQVVVDSVGPNWLSRLKLFTSFDTRNNVFNPTKGTLVSLNGELIGGPLGGDQSYYILQGGFTQYFNFFQKHVIEFRLRLGASQAFGKSSDVPVFDRFFAGGLGTVRGYNYRRVGPLENGNSVGGQTLGIVNLEYTFPVPKLDFVRGALFIDAGQAALDPYSLDFNKFAVSIGPGVKIKTPLGPVALYYGFPIANKDTEDRNGKFEFSLGTGF